MKRLCITLMVLVLALFLGGAALAGAPDLTGTTWEGTINYASAPGLAPGEFGFFSSDEISITIISQDAFGNFFGTLTNHPVIGDLKIHPMTGNVSPDKTFTTCTLTPNNFPDEIATGLGKVMDNKISGVTNGFAPSSGFVYTGKIELTKTGISSRLTGKAT